jgi:predicted dinucleotide-binding enzyme
MVDAGIIASDFALAHRLVIVLANEMGADAVDIGKTIHPHFTPGESSAAELQGHEAALAQVAPVNGLWTL